MIAALVLTAYHAFVLAPRVSALALSANPSVAAPLRARSLLVNGTNLALSLAILLLGVLLRYLQR